MKEKMLTRDIIVKSFTEALRPLDYVYAFYEGGAIAFNRVDEWSDLDFCLVVDDEKMNETFVAVEKILSLLSPVKEKFDLPQTAWGPEISQVFYRLKDANEYLIIDLCVLKLGSSEKFLEPEIHGNVVFYFNKSNKVKPLPMDRDAFVRKLNERLERLRTRFDMFNNLVQKEINRGHHLEALDLYHNFTLATLVETLRIKHNPIHYNFKMEYLHYELPSKIIKKLEHLYFVKDEKDLQEKYHEAIKCFNKAMKEIDQKEIERLIKAS